VLASLSIAKKVKYLGLAKFLNRLITAKTTT